MAPRISLALALHNHQPVGNFGWVFAEVYDAGLPADGRGARAPPDASACRSTTRGPLLDWLRAERPEFIERFGALVARDQVEILGGGYYEPVLASLPERDRVGQLARMGDELEATVRPAAARRVARRARLGAGPADLAGRRRLRLDDPRRRPLPGGGDPRGGPLGPVHDRGPGQPPEGLRDRAGPALPDPVPRRRRGHRLPARPRHRGRRADRDDGRRRREVRRVADDLGALLGRGPLGRPLLRGARGERRLADDDARRPTGWPTHPPDRARLHPDRLVRRDGRVGAAGRREPRLPRGPQGRQGARTGPRRAGCAARSGATSRSSTARSTTSTSRCCGRRTRSTRWPTGPGPGARARPPVPGPVERLLLARPVRRHLHRPHAAGDVRAPDRRRGPRRHGRRPARMPPSVVDLDLDGLDDVRLAGAGPGRHDRPDRGRRHRRLGHPAGPARPGGRHAPPARGLPRDPARPRGRGRRGRRGGDGDRATRRRRSTTSS